MIIPMKTLRKKAVCLLLCAIMAAGLAACAKPAQTIADPTARSDGRVYVENKMALDIGEKEIRSVRMLPDGNFIAMVIDTTQGYKTEIGLFDAEGKQLHSQPAGEHIQNIDNMCVGLDGKVYALERRYEMSDMPEMPQPAADEGTATGTDADTATGTNAGAATGTDAKPDEATGTDAAQEGAVVIGGGESSSIVSEPPPMKMYVHRFNAGGELETSVELKLPADKQGNDYYTRAIQSDEKGRLYLAMMGGGMRYSPDGGELLRFAPDGTFDRVLLTNCPDQFVLLPGGDAVMASYGGMNNSIRCVELETGREKYTQGTNNYFEQLSYSASEGCVYAFGNGRVVCVSEDGIKDIAYLSDYSIMSPLLQIESFAVGGDERLYFVMNKRPSEYERMQEQLENKPWTTAKCELSVLSLVDAAQAPKRKEITVSVMMQDYNMTQAASAFQSLHPDIVVKVRELVPSSEMDYSSTDSVLEYIKKVNTEILTGKAADIISLANLPYQQYQEKNILYDISGLMKNDPDFTDENYFMNVIRAYEQDGKQFALPKGFYANMLMAPKSMQLPESGFSLKAFISFCDSLPEDKVPMGMGSPESVFQLFIQPNLGYFLDMKNKQARLDTPEFIELLEASMRIGSRGERFDFQSNDPMAYQQYMDYTREHVVFQQTALFDYNYRAQMVQMMDGEGMLLPYPGIDGPSYFFSTSELYGINKAAKDKEACWEFLKFLVSEDFLQMASYGQITINKKVNRKISDLRIELDKSDQAGRSVMIDMNGREYEMPKLTREDVDTVNALVGRFDETTDYDSKLYQLLMDEVMPFFEGSKDARSAAEAAQSRVSMYLSE